MGIDSLNGVCTGKQANGQSQSKDLGVGTDLTVLRARQIIWCVAPVSALVSLVPIRFQIAAKNAGVART